MADSYNVLNRAVSLDVSPEVAGYSGVVIFTGLQDDDGNNIEYRAGDDSGTVLEITNEWGSQEQADAIYQIIRGHRYQPYNATGTILDPSAEIGDAVTIKDVYSGIYARATTFGKMMRSNISAPGKEEIEHEFQIQSPSNRQYERFTRSVKSSIRQTANDLSFEVSARIAQGNDLSSRISINALGIQQEVTRATQIEGNLSTLITQNADKIEARAMRSGGNGAGTFGWTLDPSGHSWWQSDPNNPLMRISAAGLEVNGNIRSGRIGDPNGGFVITASAIYNNMPSFWGSQTNGVYIGTDGIALGQNFRVDSSGNLVAHSGTFGSLNVDWAGNTAGTYSGSLSGCGGSVSGLQGSLNDVTGSLSTGINIGNTSIGTYVENIVANKITATYITSLFSTTSFSVSSEIRTAKLIYDDHTVTRGYVVDKSGVARQVLVWQ